MNKLRIFLYTFTMFALNVSCGDDEARPKVFDLDYMAHVYPENFVTVIDNPFMPLTVGSTYHYTGETPGGTETVDIEVLPEKKMVMGISCTVVLDRAYLNDELIEETYDWYAQDRDGNVWYMGEAVDNYVGGVVNNHYGSWEAGVDGAEPGIVMLGNPVIGLQYRQEHYIGEAEDQGKVLSKTEPVTVPAGSFLNCLKVEETNPLDKNFLEYKYYAKGVGLVRVEVIDSPIEIEELLFYDLK